MYLVASVVSDPLWPHGPWPARLLCPWDSPGKNTGVACQKESRLFKRVQLFQWVESYIYDKYTFTCAINQYSHSHYEYKNNNYLHFSSKISRPLGLSIIFFLGIITSVLLILRVGLLQFIRVGEQKEREYLSKERAGMEIKHIVGSMILEWETGWDPLHRSVP